MKLIGSTTSPFVRRLRLYFMQLAVTNYEFINVDIFSVEGRKLLTENNPAQKVPALIDEELCLYDSRVISRYLAQKYQQPSLTWSQENLLTLIDAANDSLVSLLLLKRSSFDINDDKLFFNLQHERVEQILSALNHSVEDGEFHDWHYPAICLYCLLDWGVFRDLIVINRFDALATFYKQAQVQKGIRETDPR